MARLRFVEIDLRPPLPSPKTLAGWRKEAPEGFTFAAVAPPTLYGDPTWPLRDEARTRSELDRMMNNAKALAARVVVFRTPMAVTPGSVALRRLQATLERARKLAPEGSLVVWEPSGLWEHAEAVTAVRDQGVTVACDPLHTTLGDQPLVYGRLRGLGVEQRYDAAKLEDLVAALAGTPEVYVVFQSAAGWAEAVALARATGTLVGEAADDTDGDGDEDGEDGEDFDDEDGEGFDDEDGDGDEG